MGPFSKRRFSRYRYVRYAAHLASALVGLGCFVFAMGLPTLDPTNVGWLLRGDWAPHFLGWSFFRVEPWGFPLGFFSGYLYPVGGVVANSDSIPWLAVIFRIFSPLLPANFQYTGCWLALCFTLQGILGAAIARRFSADAWSYSLAGMLFPLSPPLLFRLAHASLSAQWQILSMVALNLAPVSGTRDRTRLLLVSFLVVVVSAGTHPYFTAMVLPLSGALVVRLWWCDGVLSARQGVMFLLAETVATGLVFSGFGMFGGSMSMGGWGFGEFSADLLTFGNSLGMSAFLPGLPTRPGQYEGFAYFGAGGLLLGFSAITIALYRWPLVTRSHKKGTYIPLIGASCLLAVFSFSDTVTALGVPVLHLHRLYNWRLEQIWGIFRSSGRFIWPLYYVTLTLVLAVVLRHLSRRSAIMLLTVAVAIQAVDIQVIGGRVAGQKESRALESRAWDLARGTYRHLVLYPPQFIGAEKQCGTVIVEARHDEYVQFAYKAYLLGLTINSGYLARPKADALGTYCTELRAQVTNGAFASDAIYVFRDHDSATLHLDRMVCGRLDGYDVCVVAEHPTRLSAYLRYGHSDQ